MQLDAAVVMGGAHGSGLRTLSDLPPKAPGCHCGSPQPSAASSELTSAIGAMPTTWLPGKLPEHPEADFVARRA
jgi:hypothetical protein